MLYIMGLGFCVCSALSVLIASNRCVHLRLGLDDTVGIQKIHKIPTPRIGGLAVAASFLAVWFCLDGELRRIWGLLALAGLPAFVFGLLEDITRKVGVRLRLFATIASGATFAVLSGYSVSSLDFALLDALLAVSLVSIIFTGFAIGGAANSFNIIDGFHGLASGTMIIVLASFAIVSHRVGDATLTNLSLLMIGLVAGFFVVNFPYGKIFLGDAGAYFLGFIIAGIAVMLPARNPEISPWISLMLLTYPVTETGVSIARRLMKKGGNPGLADCDHLHHLVHRTLACRAANALRIPGAANALTSPIMWLLPFLAFASACISDLKTPSAVLFTVTLVSIYLVLYLYSARREFWGAGRTALFPAE